MNTELTEAEIQAQQPTAAKLIASIIAEIFGLRDAVAVSTGRPVEGGSQAVPVRQQPSRSPPA